MLSYELGHECSLIIIFDESCQLPFDVIVIVQDRIVEVIVIFLPFGEDAAVLLKRLTLAFLALVLTLAGNGSSLTFMTQVCIVFSIVASSNSSYWATRKLCLPGLRKTGYTYTGSFLAAAWRARSELIKHGRLYCRFAISMSAHFFL